MNLKNEILELTKGIEVTPEMRPALRTHLRYATRNTECHGNEIDDALDDFFNEVS